MYQLRNECLSVSVSPTGAQLCSLYSPVSDTQYLWQPGADTDRVWERKPGIQMLLSAQEKTISSPSGWAEKNRGDS